MHEPDHGHGSGGGPSESIPPMPPHPPRAAGQWEVIAGPGPDREPGPTLWARWRRRSARARAVTVAAAVVALALGGTVAYAAGSGGSGAGVVPAAGSSSGPPSPDGHGHGPGFGWFGLGGGGVHGEVTVKDRDTGKWVVRTWQRGTVEKVDGDQVTVRSDDGARWSWTVGPDAKVHREGSSGKGAGALKKGDKAFLAGTRSDNGARTAALAVAGTFDHMGPGEGREGRRGFPGHGGPPWGHPGRTASPSPTGSGATT